MTHPDILAAERFGCVGGYPKTIGKCKECGSEIEEGNTYYDDHEGGLFCCLECVFESVGIRERGM